MFCLYSISLNTRLYDAFCSAVKDPINSGKPALYNPCNHSAGKHLARTSQKLSFPHIKASCAKPSSLPMMLSLLGIVWFRPLHCYYNVHCYVILSSWLSSSSRSSFVFATKFWYIFFYHYVSDWIWFDLNVCISSFWRQSVLMLQHIFIVVT